MNNKLSIASRIIVAFASGALIAVFFLPAWRIDLFAPQYPEGLTMYIWINNITGDVEVINGLNHYIGMKHITVDMFPEFRFLPFVVGFFMLLGVLVAITGSRRFLLYYIILTFIGGALAMYDFYQWGYDYGHNLDPKAAIQVPGLSYQPPLFGHKRLLNFDAYSFPDVGGWIVVGAAMLITGIWLAEWYHQRKTKKKISTTHVLAVLLPIFLLSSCSAQPEPFKYGTDECHACKMTIMDPKFGCEIITTKGKLYKFDDAICIARFLTENKLAEKDIKQTLVINFDKQNDFLAVNKAVFVLAQAVKTPMNSHVAAFATKDAAEKFSADKSGAILNWKEVLLKLQ